MRRGSLLAFLLALAAGGALLGHAEAGARTDHAARATAKHAAAARADAARTAAARAHRAALAKLTRRLRRAWRTSSASGAYVVDLDSGRRVFSSRAGTRRAPASVEKLYTSTAMLLHYGAAGTLRTRVLGSGSLRRNGTWRGNLYLVGGGDPTFGSRRTAEARYGTHPATVQGLARQLDRAGIKRVRGGVRGDESLFDSRRGPPSSGGHVSYWVGPLSAVDFDRGLLPNGSFQANPPAYAAARLAAALRRRHIPVSGHSGAGRAPRGARPLAAVHSPPVATLLRLQNLDSDNYFAETLIKGLGARFGAAGSTHAGARVVTRAIHRLAGTSPRIVDGSGLSRRDHTSPREVVRLLSSMWPGPTKAARRARRRRGLPAVPATALRTGASRSDARALLRSLPTAAVSGTLADRMGGTAAAGRCHAKTGTLTGVSALAGYCTSHAGDTFAFAFLMNNANIASAHAVQDREAELLAAYGS